MTSSPRDQIITSLPESTFQTPPATRNSPGSTSWFYERFVVRAARPTTGVWLCCSSHPFFADLSNMPQDQIAFFNRVFAREGDIFEEAVFDLEAVKEVILKGIFEGVQELEFFSILDVPGEVIGRVARVISTASKVQDPCRLAGRRDWRKSALNGTMPLWQAGESICRVGPRGCVRSWIKLTKSWEKYAPRCL